jgi:voltage-gated sodium channel
MNSKDQAIAEKRLWGPRERVASIVEHQRFRIAVTVLILLNSITIGMETDPQVMASYGGILHFIDTLILIIFSVEIALKFYAYRMAFFRSGWNVFDLIIVGIAWVPASGAFAVLRTLRILRALRLLSVVPQMRRLISAIGHSIPGMTSVVSVLGLIFYVASVLATKLFGTHPNPEMQEWFGSIGASAYTLFQVMTLESWSMGIVRPTMELFSWSWLFFIPFIIITSFAVLNFFIGIIVDSMQIVQRDDCAQQEVDASNRDIAISEQIRELSAKLDRLSDRLDDRLNDRLDGQLDEQLEKETDAKGRSRE